MVKPPPTIQPGLATPVNDGHCVSDVLPVKQPPVLQAKQLPQSGPPVAKASPVFKKSPKFAPGSLLPKVPPPQPKEPAKFAPGSLSPKGPPPQPPAPNFGDTGSAPIEAQEVDNLDYVDPEDEAFSLMPRGIYNKGPPKTGLSTLSKVEDAAISLADRGIYNTAPPATGLSTLLKVIDAGTTSIAGSSAPSEVVTTGTAFLGEEDQYVPDRVQRIWWDANPNKLDTIITSDLTPNMQGFLRNHHDDSAQNGWSQWSYNSIGYHPIHTLIEALCAKGSSFPKEHLQFRYWEQDRKDTFVLNLVQEAVRLTNREYGACTCRTQCDRPPNNTPLMFFAKAECKVVNRRTRFEILEKLVWQGGGLGEVDSNGTNAVMHAAGSGNRDVFLWFYDRKSRVGNRLRLQLEP